jgi:class 3 adenylate cyclase
MAARIEQLNKKFESELLVSEAVIKNIDHVPARCKHLGQVHLKGLRDSFSVYKLA